MQIERVAFTEIRPSPYNPRKDLQPGDAEYQRIKASLDEFGIVEPLVWNRRSGNLVGGHQRFKMLQERGDSAADVSVVDLDEIAEKKLNLALNKVEGDWDLPKLGEMLAELPDLDFTGFDAGELNGIFEDLGRPLFEPNTEPSIEPRTVTAEEVSRTATRMETRFEGGRELREVMCPRCGQEFSIDA